MRRIIAAVVLLATFMPTAPAGVLVGFAAYQRGDYVTALREWRPLAEQGDMYAQFNLGILYDNGQGVPQDHVKAARWYRKAAEQGHTDAQRVLGVLYLSGRGVPVDLVLAHMWLNLALAKFPAGTARDEVRKTVIQLTLALAQAGLLGEAQRMARKWEEEHRTEGQQ